MEVMSELGKVGKLKTWGGGDKSRLSGEWEEDARKGETIGCAKEEKGEIVGEGGMGKMKCRPTSFGSPTSNIYCQRSSEDPGL